MQKEAKEIEQPTKKIEIKRFYTPPGIMRVYRKVPGEDKLELIFEGEPKPEEPPKE